MPIYRNRTIFNQRGGSIDINNTTDSESIQLSHRSGSNINLNNVVNSELATNNKQTNIVNDSFKTVGKDDSEYVSKDKILRVGENTITLKGFRNPSEMEAIEAWKESYRPIANLNSEFKTKRGGKSYPNGVETEQEGERLDNPIPRFPVVSVENKFDGYNKVPVRYASSDEVVDYVSVINKDNVAPAGKHSLTTEDIEKSAGPTGSKAPAVLAFGAEKFGATEGGSWSPNLSALKIDKVILDKQKELIPLEQAMGNGGDEISFIKRNKIETIGVINDYPSIRIDETGRSQPLEMLVSKKGTFKNHDTIPHVEEVDNTNFPGGEVTQTIGNKWNVLVGSGGINLKTLGCVEFGGATLKAGFKKINISASHGLHLASEEQIELQSIKSITLRTNRQVFVEGAMGVKNNLIVGGGVSVEGELYVQHITAPLEVHQTEDTIVFGKFAADEDRSLLIGEVFIGGFWFPCYAKASDNLLVTYPHSHHHNGPPMRLTRSNSDVREFAHEEGINKHDNITQALSQNHQRKTAEEA